MADVVYLIRPRFPQFAATLQRLVICVRSVLICGERVKGRTVLKWAIGVIAIVVLVGVGAMAWLVSFHVAGKRRAASPPVAGGAGLWTVGLWRSAGIVSCCPSYREERPEAIRTAAKGLADSGDRDETVRRCSTSL